MGAIRLVIVLLVAAVSSIILFVVVRGMTAKRPAAPVVVAAAPARPMARVLVAKRALKVADRLAPTDMAWQPWPLDAMNPAFVSGGPINANANIADKAGAALQAVTQSDPHIIELTGSLVREPILANEPINMGKLVRGGQGGFLAVKLPQGMRAMALPVTVDTSAGGFVLPGDHVDVVLSVKPVGGSDQGPAAHAKSHIVMNNLKVLAIDQNLEPKAGSASVVGATATLQVAAADVDEMARAKDEGALTLVLRSYEDMGGPTGRAVPKVSHKARPREEPIRLYVGDKVTELRATP